MSFLIVSCSLNPESRSRNLAKRAGLALREKGAIVDFMDLMATPLPFCDGHSVYKQSAVQTAADRVHKAQGILLSVPIYNYDANAATKNLQAGDADDKEFERRLKVTDRLLKERKQNQEAAIRASQEDTNRAKAQVNEILTEVRQQPTENRPN